jgi:hypothetical protein
MEANLRLIIACDRILPQEMEPGREKKRILNLQHVSKHQCGRTKNRMIYFMLSSNVILHWEWIDKPPVSKEKQIE